MHLWVDGTLVLGSHQFINGDHGIFLPLWLPLPTKGKLKFLNLIIHNFWCNLFMYRAKVNDFTAGLGKNSQKFQL